MSVVKTELLTTATEDLKSKPSFSVINKQKLDDEKPGSLLHRRGSVTLPRRRLICDYNVTSESDSELILEKPKNSRNSPTLARKTFNRFNAEIHKVEERIEQALLHLWDVVSHHSLPEWLKDNEYLLAGHRPQLPSYWACFRSIFRIHTETGNIWSHLLGCLAFVAIATYVLLLPSVEMQLYDRLVMAVYCVGAVVCMGFSWLFHTLYCHSPPVGKLFGKLDYCGISVMVMASFVPWVYYAFYCHMAPKIIYLTMSTFFGILCIFISLDDQFSDRQYRPYRAAIFVSFGCSGFIPVIHFIFAQGLSNPLFKIAFVWLLITAACYLTGAAIYAYRVPERFWPGKFDYWGQSHQIFHLFVIAGAFATYHGITLAHKNLAAISQCTLGDSDFLATKGLMNETVSFH